MVTGLHGIPLHVHARHCMAHFVPNATWPTVTVSIWQTGTRPGVAGRLLLFGMLLTLEVQRGPCSESRLHKVNRSGQCRGGAGWYSLRAVQGW